MNNHHQAIRKMASPGSWELHRNQLKIKILLWM